MIKKKVAIVGMGPAGLMAGTELLSQGMEVHFFDHKKAAGRKFLVAGNGGFNLTHSEEPAVFATRYTHSYLQDAFFKFDNQQWIAFLKKVGIPTFIGSSGKIFPVKEIKPIQVLNNWLSHLQQLGAYFHYEHKFLDFVSNQITFEYQQKTILIPFDFLVLAMGGASWSKTGSTGDWQNLLLAKNIPFIPFVASNSGFEIDEWEKMKSLEGQVLKNCVFTFNGISKSGECVISMYGLEGSPIYYLNKEFRKHPKQLLSIDLKPSKTVDEIKNILLKAKNATSGLKNLNLSQTAIQLIRLQSDKETFSSPALLAQKIKVLPFSIQSLRPIDEVISTVGGLSMEAITPQFQLKQYPKVYACGEMLDWDAPTGGYLIQGCVASGYTAAKAIAESVNKK